jgi:mono/diheme cytochrome c family protein
LILFKCADGYQDAVPTENLLTFNSLLAYKIEPKIKNAVVPPFSLVNEGQHETIADLGPLYLVWDNSSNKELKAEESTHWPYQVVEIELAQFKNKFPKMVPRIESPAVINGFKNFQKYCMSCHKINGEGGEKGPDLNLPINIFSRLDEKLVRKQIDNPQSLNPQSTMPPLRLNIADRKKVIEDILVYLHSMKN